MRDNSTAAYLDSEKRFIDEKLDNLLTSENPLLSRLYGAIRYAVFSGGKRIRPIFCLLVGEIFEVPKEKLASVACALEMIHTASLIMDDLPHMDNAAKRRGKDAIHIKFGQDLAELACVGLMMRAYEVILEDPMLSDSERVRVTATVAKTVGIEGMVGGQYLDLKCRRGDLEAATLSYIHTRKTAGLFIASGKVGGIIGKASEEEMQAVESYALNLGIVFQIIDDVLDHSKGSENRRGASSPEESNFVLIHGIEKAKLKIEQHTKLSIDSVRLFNQRNKQLVNLALFLSSRKI